MGTVRWVLFPGKFSFVFTLNVRLDRTEVV